jgi:hypothetical protein
MKQYKTMSLADQRLLVDSKLVEIFQYPRWGEVLEFLDLAPSKTPSLKANNGAGYGGEGPQHKALKEFVSSNPAVVNLPKSQANGDIEYALPSGDSVDVMFVGKAGFTAVEVKSVISNDADIERGLFQCVKYQAVTEALLKVNGAPINVRTILVLGGEFPKALLSLKNMLGVEVIDGLQP